MAHNFESGFFANKAAWHGLGTVLDNPPNTSQALSEAQLNWTVEEKPIFGQIDDNFTVIPTHKSLVRSTDGQLLGIVSKHYSPLQNQDAFEWFDFLLHDGDVSLEAAGSLKEGKRV
jgi:Domain of unknown function (DUF932)